MRNRFGIVSVKDAKWGAGELREGARSAEALAAGDVMLATRLSTRLRGLLFTPEAAGLLVLLPCGDIHTFGMRYAIDVAFVDGRGRVLRAVRDVLPNRRLREPHAVAVLERCAVPREAWFEEGDRIALGRYRPVLREQVASGPLNAGEETAGKARMS